MVWFIREEELFAINEPVKATIKEVGKEKNKVIIVDDFYKDPDAVRHLALNAPVTRWQTVTSGFPMWRTAMDLNLEPIRQKISELSQEAWGYKIEEIPRFMTNLLRDDEETRTQKVGLGGAPHADHCILSAIVYLNPPEECGGGTAFYRHRETGIESLPRHPFFAEDVDKSIAPIALKFGCQNLKEFAEKVVFKEEAFQVDRPIQDSNEYWELIDWVEMRYNRLVFYEGRVLHAPYRKGKQYKDCFRVIQSMFWVGGVTF